MGARTEVLCAALDQRRAAGKLSDPGLSQFSVVDAGDSSPKCRGSTAQR
jgi:hypothetical protein